VWFVKRELVDVAENVVERSFNSYKLPAQEEGFAEVRYDWSAAQDATKKMKHFMVERQKSERLELTKPQWFTEHAQKWIETYREWRKTATLAKPKAAAKVEEPAAKKSKTEDGEDAKAEENAEDAIGEEEPEIWSCEDVCDTGDGTPLFRKFSKEDWAMLTLRYEIHLLIHAFAMAAGGDRPGIHESTISHYYNKFFGKNFSPAFFGKKDLAGVVALIVDTVSIGDASGCLEFGHPDETPMDTFVKLTEEARRERKARIEAGDESAEIKLNDKALASAKSSGKGGRSDNRNRGHHDGRSGKGGFKGGKAPRGPPVPGHHKSYSQSYRAPVTARSSPYDRPGARPAPPSYSARPYASGAAPQYGGAAYTGSRPTYQSQSYAFRR
jgi:hypothetical protein